MKCIIMNNAYKQPDRWSMIMSILTTTVIHVDTSIHADSKMAIYKIGKSTTNIHSAPPHRPT